MQFIDIKAINQQSSSQIDAAVAKVFEHGRYINGPEICELEATLGEFLCGTKPLYWVAVASGTMALEVALRTLGIGSGDEVITSPFTWISTAETIALVGARPVFADIDADTYNIKPSEVEKLITPKTKAIIAVNLFGQMADYPALEAIAEKYGLKIIEDAARSFGAEQNGRKSGTIGAVSCTSFFPAKPLGAYGDGGAVFTADTQLDEALRAVANHGSKKPESHYTLGTNGRCDSLQAAIMQAKFANFRDKEITLRLQVGACYSEALMNHVTVPVIRPGNTHIYAQYTIRPRDRSSLGKALKAAEIPSPIYYRKPLHQQAVFADLHCAKKTFPETDKAAQEVISLPFHPYLNKSDQDRIIAALIAYERA